MQFTITKPGKLRIRLAQGNLCGLSDGSRELEFAYTIKMSGDGPQLDKRAFLIDHFEVDDAIQAWCKSGKWSGSCEQVAIAILDLVYGMNSEIAIEVALTGGSGTTIAAQRTASERANHIPRGKMSKQ